MSDPADFRTQFLKAAEDSGLNDAEIARKAGVKYNIVRDLRRREGSSTRTENAVALARALGFSYLPPVSAGHDLSEDRATYDPGRPDDIIEAMLRKGLLRRNPDGTYSDTDAARQAVRPDPAPTDSPPPATGNSGPGLGDFELSMKNDVVTLTAKLATRDLPRLIARLEKLRDIYDEG